MKKKIIPFVLMLFFSFGRAQNVDSLSQKWEFLAEPYLIFPQMNGKVGIGISLPYIPYDFIGPAKVKKTTGEIFSNLRLGGMLSFEARKADWAFAADFLYMSLREDVEKIPDIVGSGTFSSQQFAMEFAVLKKITPSLEVGAGGILINVKAGFNLNTNFTNPYDGKNTYNRSLSEVWVEPVLIARTQNRPGAKFIYSVRADAGGFGVGSDFAWQLQGYAGYRFNRHIQATGGYRYISLDRDKGTGSNRFLYDMDIFGPVVRLGYLF